jgi:N-hydroxyarylamine O-acetyltransferase
MTSPTLSPSDLAAYLARIGYDGPVAPTRAALDRLHLLHPQAIPFENLNPLAGLPVRIDLASVVAKLVRSKRGGYCFEHNTLFRAVLEAFGFAVTPLFGRVLMGQAEDMQTAQTHKLLHLTCEGEDLIADVGFGGMTLTGPMRLVPGLDQQTPHEPYRLDRTGEDWWLRAQVAGDWRLLYRFTLRPTWPVDEEVSNHYVATHSASAFTTTLRVARILPRGRLALLNRRLTEHRLGEASLVQDIADDAALRAVLLERFGIEEADEVWAKAVTRIA